MGHFCVRTRIFKMPEIIDLINKMKRLFLLWHPRHLVTKNIMYFDLYSDYYILVKSLHLETKCGRL